MKISTIKEKFKNENRLAISPDAAKAYLKAGHEVFVEKGSGLGSNFSDNNFETAGAKVSAVPLEILADADLILKVKPSKDDPEFSEFSLAKEGAVIIGFFDPHNNKELIEHYASKKVTLLSMELVPRTTKAQSFDALSSQANLIGYRAVLEASYHYRRSFPMFMTAAGTVNPAKVLILGAGVAGLQAIATAKRLGAQVSAYDVRSAAKEQVESLGAKFIHPDLNIDFSASGGYAKEVDENFAKRQEEMLLSEMEKYDIIVTTAMIPGKKAPTLITKEMVKSLKRGSVIVDIASASGGNTEVTSKDEIVDINGVKIIGYSNLIGSISEEASKLYSRNIQNLVNYAFKDKLELDMEDEIIKSMTLTHKGEVFFKNV